MSLESIKYGNVYAYAQLKRYGNVPDKYFSAEYEKMIKDDPELAAVADSGGLEAMTQKQINMGQSGQTVAFEIRADKNERILKTIQALCKRIGREAPQSFDEIDETDYALFNVQSTLSKNKGYYNGMVMQVHSPSYDNTSGFNHIYQTALDMAGMLDNFDDLYSPEGINKLIASQSVYFGENVDKKVLYDYINGIGEEQTAVLKENIESFINGVSKLYAKSAMSHIREDYASDRKESIESDDSYEPMADSVKKWIYESMDMAHNIIYQGDENTSAKDYINRLAEHSYENSDITFTIDGKKYTMQEFRDAFINIYEKEKNIFMDNMK